jgi:hypothetical protein
MKRLTILFIIFFVIIDCSCKNKIIKDKLEGVWFSESNEHNLFSVGFMKIESDSSRYFPQNFPVLYDFKSDGTLLMKNIEGNDTTFHWSMKSKSTLTINNLDFQVKFNGGDNLKLVFKKKNDYREFSFIKPRKIKLEKTEEEIKNILLSNVWSVKDTTLENFATNFEYLDNKTVIYRDRFLDNKLKKETDNIQMETWGITKYKDYVFLYNYVNMKIGIGNWNSMRQISQISDSTYSLIDSFHRKEINYRSKGKQNNKATTESILGKWESKNKLNGLYGIYNKNAVEQGRMVLFDGDLELQICESKLILRIKDYQPIEYNWQISKDSKTLVIESVNSKYWTEGIRVDCADILELTDKKLKIRLFNNFFNFENVNSQMFILNIIQEFERIE